MADRWEELAAQQESTPPASGSTDSWTRLSEEEAQRNPSFFRRVGNVIGITSSAPAQPRRSLLPAMGTASPQPPPSPADGSGAADPSFLNLRELDRDRSPGPPRRYCQHKAGRLLASLALCQLLPKSRSSPSLAFQNWNPPRR